MRQASEREIAKYNVRINMKINEIVKTHIVLYFVRVIQFWRLMSFRKSLKGSTVNQIIKLWR